MCDVCGFLSVQKSSATSLQVSVLLTSLPPTRKGIPVSPPQSVFTSPAVLELINSIQGLTWEVHTDPSDALSSEAQENSRGGGGGGGRGWDLTLSQPSALTSFHGQTSGTSKPHLLQPVLATHSTVQFPALASVPASLYKVIHDLPVQKGGLTGVLPTLGSL